MEQVVELFALACCEPEDCGRPISYWTTRELAEEMVKQGRVESISPRHVGRLLEEAQIKPYSESLLVDSPLDKEFDTKESPKHHELIHHSNRTSCRRGTNSLH
jgi:hypothetical protein